MTLNEKKIIVDYLKNGCEVGKIILSDLIENEYPQEIHEILRGVLNSIMEVDVLNKFNINNDAENIMHEIECNFALEEKQNFELLAEQLHMMADEDEAFKNRIFEIGINAILEEFYRENAGISIDSEQNNTFD
ncbi:MAG: hypothetical protein E6600_04730 [Anaerocolumna aminovalerica]|uniref:hypothetical protein n=1 Tax=Anaerocolumna aminovalerica TaxID=1527 RepID=UPI002909D5AD|nr:hypothetical protein [Anaerocolumna aminovalerica]MDU6263788.1 hypothetical protein [Anaerocolumna aminovalerica]